MDERRKQEIDRLAELAHVGAGHAAGAFAQLVGRTIRTEVPRVVEGADASDTLGSGRRSRHGDAELVTTGRQWCTGVFFEFEGCLDAIVGILFPGPSSEALVRCIVGIEEGELAPALIESALMEVGNILASHVASAIADTLGERLLPSIPSLAMEDAEAKLASWIGERVGDESLRFECILHDDADELEGRLVMVPTGRIAAGSDSGKDLDPGPVLDQ